MSPDQLKQKHKGLENHITKLENHFDPLVELSILQEQIQLNQQECERAIEIAQAYRNDIGRFLHFLENDMGIYQHTAKQLSLIRLLNTMICSAMHLLFLFEALRHAAVDSPNRVVLRIEGWKLIRALLNDYQSTQKKAEEFSIWLSRAEISILPKEDSQQNAKG